MSQDSAKLDLLLNEIEENCSSSKYQASVLPFMFDCACLIEHRMPKIALDCLSVAKDFAENRGDREALIEAVRACWQALGKGDASQNLANPEVSAIRVVICILHWQLSPDADEFLDLLSFLMQLVNNVEPSYEKQEVLIKRRFIGCL
jgi:hypothetical protein